MKHFLILLGITFISLFALPLAHGEPIERPIDFAIDIHPIFVTQCFECHGSGQRKGGFQLNTREQVLQGTPFGEVVTPGDPDGSLLIKLVSSANPAERMPPDGDPLSARQIALLRAWIAQDLPWSDEVEAASDYKAPLNLMESAPPEVLSQGTGHLIDRYLDAYLLEHGLEKPAPVDDKTFARRAWLDTTGLLPAPQLLERFEALGLPGKRNGLVKTLLSQDAEYAQHWITFWNDRLRNDFEGTGYIDGGRKQITDWLFDSLLSNKPYDQFVRELIAPSSSQAEGFIRGIVWRGDNATVQLPSMQAANNVSQVFMGINLKCASCHDSFIDDWSLREAFSLANVFSDDPMELVRCDAPTGEMADYGFLWPELGAIDSGLTREERMARVAELATKQENGHFARTKVNRVWAELMGHGFVEPLDAMEREPWHPALLDAIALEFVASGYDVKQLLYLIMSSEAYQWPAVPRAEQDSEAYRFTGPEVRRLSAEQFYDALGQLTGVWQAHPKFLLPEERDENEEERQARLAAALAGGRTEELPASAQTLEGRLQPVRAWRVSADPLMLAMGRPNRDQVTTRREKDFTTLQALELSNGEALARHLQLGATALLLKHDGEIDNLITSLYHGAYGRNPTDAERDLALAVLGAEADKQHGLEDLLWILVMSPEFQLVL